MATYTTWAQVEDVWSRAGDVEKFSAAQTALITAKSNLFQSYIRNIHKEDLTGTVDEVVNIAVANLVADELMLRRITDDTELIDVEYDHFKGRVTRAGAMAHSTIDAIRRGAIVLGQDVADHDVNHPVAVPDSDNTSTGVVEAYLPHEYKSDRSDEYLIKITTAGRVDDSTAIYAVYQNNSATALAEGVTASSGWVHINNELYIRFLDKAQSADQFVLNNTWTINVYPSTANARGDSPRELNFYSG